jgi:hypothetical protein
MVSDDDVSLILSKMAQAITRISRYKRLGQPMKAMTHLQETLREVLGMNPKSLGWFSHRDLMQIISRGGEPDPKRCLLLARLFKERGELDEWRGDERGAYENRVKSLNIYLECMTPPLSEQVPESYRQETEDLMDELVSTLDSYRLPPQTLLLMLNFHEKRGNYAEAEDILFELLEQPGSEQERNDWVKTGLAFYERLLEKSRRELDRGALPHEDVLQNMQE